MTCRHQPGDPECSSTTHQQKAAYYKMMYDRQPAEAKASLEPKTPDAENFDILDIAEPYGQLIIRVKYPNCRNCSYEGVKVLVYERRTVRDVLRWRKIDPHFREPSSVDPREAPPPVARFPGTDQGWKDAQNFVAYVLKERQQ